MASPMWVIAKKELKGAFTERTILLAVVIQVFVAGFSSFLVVGLSALVDPEALPTSTTPAIAVNGSSDVAPFLRQHGIDVLGYPSDAHALAAFKQGHADGALFATAPTDAGKPVSVSLYLPDGDFRSTLTLVQVKGVLESYERTLRTEREDRLAFEPLYLDTDAKAGSFSFVYSLLVPLLVFLPVVLAGALSADSLTEEVQRGTLHLLLASPATPSAVVEGKLLANVVVAPFLALAWFLLLGLNGLPVPFGGGVAILVLATALAFVMGLIACVIALVTRDRNKAHVLYATLLFFLLSASLALPVSPVNAVALFAAGSPSPGAYALVAGSVAVAAAGWLGLRLFLGRIAGWMAGGAS